METHSYHFIAIDGVMFIYIIINSIIAVSVIISAIIVVFVKNVAPPSVEVFV